jgi:ATP-dependent helicase HepA
MVPVDEDNSPWTGWADFVQHGLALFHRSISDVQFLLDELEQRAFLAMLQQGPSAMEALSSEVRDAIQEERRSQDEQYALDRIALAEEPVEAFIRGLEEAEEDESALQEGVDRWLVGALQLTKHYVAWPDRDPFKLRSTKDTLIPSTPWLQAFHLEKSPVLTWRRRVAAAHPEAVLLRPGTPLLDLAERFTRWDDRGTAFVTWRTDPQWDGGLWVGFRLCFVIEPDVPITDMLAPSRAELAALRRAQRYLPPRAVMVHMNIDGTFVEDSSLLAILTRPYRSADDGANVASDVNLGSRPHILASLVDPAAFGALCRSMRDRCRTLLLSENSICTAIAAAEQLALGDVERHRLRLRRRREEGERIPQDEIRVIETLLPAITKPALKLDAMGCFFVSSDPPDIDAHA